MCLVKKIGKKTVGVDEKQIELSKEAGEKAIDMLTALYQKICETKIWRQV